MYLHPIAPAFNSTRVGLFQAKENISYNDWYKFLKYIPKILFFGKWSAAEKNCLSIFILSTEYLNIESLII